MTRKIREVMTGSPVRVRPDTTVGDAAKLMREQGIGTVLVADGDRLVGVVTDRDLVVRVLAEEHGADAKVVGAYSSEPVCVSPEDDVVVALDLMRTKAIRRLPVVEDDGRPIGIVSLGDLALVADTGRVLNEISTAEPDW
ncbi:MAG: CBS domain-containing protein [Catenulisporales bacterium]|jgi:CBS domain-containing protein|nr:CBS domain-containing protein [Catenulisporales bacterium]